MENGQSHERNGDGAGSVDEQEKISSGSGGKGGLKGFGAKAQASHAERAGKGGEGPRKTRVRNAIRQKGKCRFRPPGSERPSSRKNAETNEKRIKRSLSAKKKGETEKSSALPETDRYPGRNNEGRKAARKSRPEC